MRDLVSELTAILYPRRCMFCGRIIAPEETCACRVKADSSLRLSGASRASSRAIKGIKLAVSSYKYGGLVANAVARFKFRGGLANARDMAEIMAEDMNAFPELPECDVIIPIPSFLNQDRHGEALAAVLAKLTGKPMKRHMLIKVRRTKKQHELSRAERAGNLFRAYRASSSAKGKRILICDDVLTSGATLREASSTLLAAGALCVCAITFSRAGS